MQLRGYVKNQFGSHKGFMRAVISELKRLLGFYKELEKIDHTTVLRLVFICSGNICRSPLGEFFAKSEGLVAESFGLDTRGGDPADPRAQSYANSKCIDMSTHSTRQIKDYTPTKGDLLIGMEPKHIKNLKKLFGNQVPMTLAGLWLSRPKAYLHDPYNTNHAYFYRCSSQVEAATKALALRVKLD